MKIIRPDICLSNILLVLTLSACTTPLPVVDDNLPTRASVFASTYIVPESPAFVIRGVRVLVGDGNELGRADVLVREGKIQAIDTQLEGLDGVGEIDGDGKWLTPGIIDVHSHMGVYPNPSIRSHADGNEIVGPVTAGVWAEHSVWPQDPNFEKAIAGGVTTIQVLPGSANLFGGRGVTLKLVPSVTMQGMKFPDAPHSLKMACGENPKRVYGEKGGPYTRMGNMLGYRKAWVEAQQYKKRWDEYHERGGEEPPRNFHLDTLMDVLNGHIKVHIHCYRADEMANMIALAEEFGYQIEAFHHATEAYKIADLLAENDICAAVWADWWGFKQEAFDMVRENAALIDYANGCAIIHSDDEIGIQRLTQEAAKVMGAATRVDININAAQAIRWLTLNSAKSLGLQDQIGSIEIGKNADLVLWNGDPFSVYSKADQVWIDGVLRFDRARPELTPSSDFNLGILSAEEDRP